VTSHVVFTVIPAIFGVAACFAAGTAGARPYRLAGSISHLRRGRLITGPKPS
jgi:hypothetical protein